MLRRTSYNKTPGYDVSVNKAHRELNQKCEKPNPLELRHQRTGDVVFDWIDPSNPFKKPSYYTYKLIETLLPKAMNMLPAGKSCSEQQFEDARKIKMVELWAQDDTPRKGWLKVNSLK